LRVLVTNLCSLLAAGALVAADCPRSRLAAADRLILRNLDIVTDRTVTALDEDGIVRDAPRPGESDRITWDQIERGTVGLDQARFDALLKELGPPLYRIRQRLKIGDYEAAGEPAEQLLPRFAQRKGQTAYLVCQAAMWSRLAAGRREAAVEPYLRCFELLRTGQAKSGNLPGSRRLAIDAKTAISPELLPVWFDADAAKAALPGVQLTIRGITQPRPEGAYLYYASLALAAGDTAEFNRVLPSIRGEDPATAPWRDILLAQQEVLAGHPGSQVDALRAAADSLPEPCRPAALYWLGQADVHSADESTIRDGILALLTLPAAYGHQQPELAAAGLYHAAAALDKLKDDRGAAAVRSELTSQFGATYFGAKARSPAAER
jgi:hypothetical protein